MLSTFLSLNAAAADSNPTTCANLTPIEQIKAYVACQGSTALAACGALGGAVAGYAGSKYLRKRYQKLMESAHDSLTHDLAEAAREDDRAARRLLDPKARLAQLDDEVQNAKHFDKVRAAFDAASKKERPFFDPENESAKPADLDRLLDEKKPLTDELARLHREHPDRPPSARERYRIRRALESAIKAHPNGPVFEPLMRHLPFDDLTLYDVANSDFDDLPEHFRTDYETRARATATLIRQRLTKGLPLDDIFIEKTARDVHATWLKEARKRPREAGMELSDDVLLKPEVEASRRVVKKAVQRLNNAETSILAKGFGPALKLAKKLGAAGPLAVGGIVGLAAYGAGQIAESHPTACAGVEAPYVNQDPNRGCASKCEVNDAVGDFLMRSPEDQREILVKFPGACAYYRDLHQCFFKRPKFESLSCQSVEGKKSRVTVKARDDAGQPREYRVDVRDDGAVNAVGVYNAAGMKTKLFNFTNADEQLTTKLGVDSGAARELRQLKLFVPEAVDCCRDQSASCAAQFNGKPSPVDPASDPASTAR